MGILFCNNIIRAESPGEKCFPRTNAAILIAASVLLPLLLTVIQCHLFDFSYKYLL